jgi:hypothetical protein
MVKDKDSVLMSLGQLARSMPSTFATSRKRSLETVLVQPNYQVLRQKEVNSNPAVHGVTKISRNKASSTHNNKLPPSTNMLDSMCAIFLSAVSDNNNSQSPSVIVTKQPRPKKSLSSTDNIKKNSQQNRKGTNKEVKVATNSARHYREERTLSSIGNVLHVTHLSSIKKGCVDPNIIEEKSISSPKIKSATTLQKLINLEENTGNIKRNSPLSQQKVQQPCNIPTPREEQLSKISDEDQSHSGEMVSSKLNPTKESTEICQSEEEIQLFDCLETNRHSHELVCNTKKSIRPKKQHENNNIICDNKDIILPRRSQRTPKPITNRLTIDWDLRTCQSSSAVERAKSAAILSSTTASGSRSIRRNRKEQRRDNVLLCTSVRKSTRSIKRVEHLVVTWDNDKRYYSRPSIESSANTSDTGGVNGSRGCEAFASKPPPPQVQFNENLVKNLDTSRFQEADHNIPSLSNPVLTDQENASLLQKSLIYSCRPSNKTVEESSITGTEHLQEDVPQQQKEGIIEEKPSSSLSPTPKLKVTKLVQLTSKSSPRRSRRKPQPTDRFTVTWTKQVRVANTSIASANVITTSPGDTEKKCGENKTLLTHQSLCNENDVTSSNPGCKTPQTLLAQSLIDLEASSEAIQKSSATISLNSATVQKDMGISEIARHECTSPQCQSEELRPKRGSFGDLSPRINNVGEKSTTCPRRSCRRPQPTDRFTVTWIKQPRVSNSVKTSAEFKVNSSNGTVHTNNFANDVSTAKNKEDTEESKDKLPASAVIQQTETCKVDNAVVTSEENWTNEEVSLLWRTVMAGVDPTAPNFWDYVAEQIKSKNATECHRRWFSLDPRCNSKGESKRKKARFDAGRGTIAMGMNSHDVDDIFNSTPMLSNASMLQRLPAHLVLPHLEDFNINSPVIRSPAAPWNREGGSEMPSPEASSQNIIPRRSPILEKKGYKGYIKSLTRQFKIMKDKRNKNSSSQDDAGGFLSKKKATSHLPLRATMGDGIIEMSATLNNYNLELRGPSDSDLEDLGIDPKASSDDDFEIDYG